MEETDLSNNEIEPTYEGRMTDKGLFINDENKTLIKNRSSN